MKDRLLMQAELAKILKERLESREWWILLPLGKEGLRVVDKIERQFYWDDAGNDFDIAFCPVGNVFPLVVALGKKARLSPNRLQELLRKDSAIPVILGNKDVVVLGGEDAERVVALMALDHVMNTTYAEMN